MAADGSDGRYEIITNYGRRLFISYLEIGNFGGRIYLEKHAGEAQGRMVPIADLLARGSSSARGLRWLTHTDVYIYIYILP